MWGMKKDASMIRFSEWAVLKLGTIIPEFKLVATASIEERQAHMQPETNRFWNLRTYFAPDTYLVDREGRLHKRSPYRPLWLSKYPIVEAEIDYQSIPADCSILDRVIASSGRFIPLPEVKAHGIARDRDGAERPCNLTFGIHNGSVIVADY